MDHLYPFSGKCATSRYGKLTANESSRADTDANPREAAPAAGDVKADAAERAVGAAARAWTALRASARSGRAELIFVLLFVCPHARNGVLVLDPTDLRHKPPVEELRSRKLRAGWELRV